MATKSFLKNVNVKTASQAKRLVEALEKAEQVRDNHVEMSRAVHEVKPDQIKNFTAKIRW